MRVLTIFLAALIAFNCSVIVADEVDQRFAPLIRDIGNPRWSIRRDADAELYALILETKNVLPLTEALRGEVTAEARLRLQNLRRRAFNEIFKDYLHLDSFVYNGVVDYLLLPDQYIWSLPSDRRIQNDTDLSLAYYNLALKDIRELGMYAGVAPYRNALEIMQLAFKYYLRDRFYAGESRETLISLIDLCSHFEKSEQVLLEDIFCGMADKRYQSVHTSDIPLGVEVRLVKLLDIMETRSYDEFHPEEFVANPLFSFYAGRWDYGF